MLSFTPSRTSHHLQVIVSFSILLIVSSFFTSCTSTTKPKTGSLSGQITLINDTGDQLLDPVDFSGVSVAIYNLAVLDTAIVRINQEYPQIGVLISQETEFDHRLQEPVIVCTTSTEGEYSVDKLTPGIYNVVFIKSGWSVTYLYQVVVTDHGNTESPSVILYPTRMIQGVVSGSFTFANGRDYLINADCTFVDAVGIENGTQIYLSEGATARFYGNVEFDDSASQESTDAWRVTSSHGIYANNEILDINSHLANSLVFYQDDISIRNGTISFLSNGIHLDTINASISSMRLRYMGSAISCVQSNVNIGMSSISHTAGTVISVISFNGLLNVSDNIIKDGIIGVSPLTSGSYSISNNYITGLATAIDTSSNLGAIQHNAFSNNSTDLKLYQAYADVSYNSFYLSLTQTIRMHYVTSQISNNNFISTTGYFFNLLSNPPSYSSVSNDVDARNNYWKNANFMDFIVDNHSNSICPHTVIVNPKRNTPVPGCGIQ